MKYKTSTTSLATEMLNQMNDKMWPGEFTALISRREGKQNDRRLDYEYICMVWLW